LSPRSSHEEPSGEEVDVEMEENDVPTGAEGETKEEVDDMGVATSTK